MINKFFAVLMLMFLLVMVAGCAGPQRDEEVLEDPVWPKPPEVARYEYNTTLRMDKAFTGEQQGFMERLGGVAASGARPLFIKPYDVASRGGVLLVSDTVARVVHMLVLSTRRVYSIGQLKGEAGLRKPTGIALDDNGRIYVADITLRKVNVYEPNGHYVMTIGGPDMFVRPSDVAVNADGTLIYVVDTGGVESGSHQIQVFDGDGQHLKTIGRRGSGEGEFNLPVQAAIGPSGDLYVLDAGNFRVQVFTADGEFVRAWGDVGRNMGDFARPRGLAVDVDGLVYVSDAAYGNVQVFRGDGQLMLAIGKSGGDLPGEYTLPAGVAIDEFGWLYIVDQRYSKVDVIKKLHVEE